MLKRQSLPSWRLTFSFARSAQYWISQRPSNWYPVLKHLSQLGGFESEFRFFRGSDVNTPARRITLECVLLWETAALAARSSEELWLLRAGQAALSSVDPFEATLRALHRGAGQSLV